MKNCRKLASVGFRKYLLVAFEKIKYPGIQIDKTLSWKEQTYQHYCFQDCARDKNAEICKYVRPTQYRKNHVQEYSLALSTILLHGMGMLH